LLSSRPRSWNDWKTHLAERTGRTQTRLVCVYRTVAGGQRGKAEQDIDKLWNKNIEAAVYYSTLSTLLHYYREIQSGAKEVGFQRRRKPHAKSSPYPSTRARRRRDGVCRGNTSQDHCLIDLVSYSSLRGLIGRKSSSRSKVWEIAMGEFSQVC